MKQLQQISQHFADLSFEEKNHRYRVKDVVLKESVSNKIGQFYKKFDSEEVSARVSKNTGVPQQQLLDDWEAINLESRERGHRVHAFGELYQFDRTLIPSCPQELALTKFWRDIPEHIVPVAAELRMYHFLHFFAGTADILLFDTKTQTYIIADYKTNKDLFKNFKGKTMLAPFSHLLDCPFSHYEIQLSLYQILLEQVGVKVSKRVVVWLGLDGEYVNYNTTDYTETLKQLL